MKFTTINYNGSNPSSNDELWDYIISTYKSATEKIQANNKKQNQLTINNKPEPIDKLPNQKNNDKQNQLTINNKPEPIDKLPNQKNNGSNPKSNKELWDYLISTYKSATEKIQENNKKAERIDTINNNKPEPIDKLPNQKNNDND